MAISTGTILKVVATLLWTDGNVAQNVFATLISGAGGPWDEGDIVDDLVAWVDAMYTTVEDQMAVAISGSQVQVYEWDPVGTDWDEIGSDPWVFIGVNVTDQLPRGVAGLLNSKSTDADSSGKKYLPGLCEGAVTDGLWTVAALADFVDFGAEYVVNFVGGITGADFDPGVWSVKDEVLNLFTNTVVIPTIPAYQRRRKRGVGI